MGRQNVALPQDDPSCIHHAETEVFASRDDLLVDPSLASNPALQPIYDSAPVFGEHNGVDLAPVIRIGESEMLDNLH